MVYIGEDRGTYEVDELDHTPLKGYFPCARLKWFYPRCGVELLTLYANSVTKKFLFQVVILLIALICLL